MAEWNIIIDSDDFPDPPNAEEPPRQPRFHVRWLVVIGVIIALLLAAALTLYRQRSDRRTALREDLVATIFEEETIRFFGDPAQADDLTIANAPERWQKAYERTFDTGSQWPPVNINITDIVYNGECVILDLTLDSAAQTRAYCQQEQRWRRAPVAATVWGQDSISMEPAPNIRLTFWPRDQEFAETVARDLAAFFDTLNQATPHDVSIPPTEIIIKPADLAPPLIAQDEAQITLNSPLLVPSSRLGGEADVRLHLAQAVLDRIYPTEAAEDTFSSMADNASSFLPGAGRLLKGIQAVIAAHLFLSPAEREVLVQSWRNHLEGRWVSPLFEYPLRPAADPADRLTAAHLMAEYIYQTGGLAGLLALVEQTPSSKSWDALFKTTLNRTTVVLENKAAAFSRGEIIDNTPTPPSETFSPPLAATVTAYKDQGPQTYVTLPDQNYPVQVEFPPDMVVPAANGVSLPARCLPPGTQIELSGEWLELQHRFAAEEITLTDDVLPLNILPAPSDSIAYLTINSKLVSLRQDGTLHPLIALTDTIQFVPLPIKGNEAPHFLFQRTLPGCDRVWFIHYQTDKGIINQWLSPPKPIEWAWRIDRQDMLFFKLEKESGQFIYQINHSASPQMIGQSEIPVTFLGWNESAKQLVFHSPWMDFTNLGLLEPNTGAISDLQMYIKPIQMRDLSPDGRWLVVLPEPDNLFERPRRLNLFDVNRLTSTKFLEIMADEGIGPTAWSLYLENPQIAILFGPLYGDDAMRLNRLAIATPGQPETLTTIVEAAAGQQLAAPVFCRNGSLLYQIEENGRFELRRWRPDTPQQTTPLTLAESFKPVACP